MKLSGEADSFREGSSATYVPTEAEHGARIQLHRLRGLNLALAIAPEGTVGEQLHPAETKRARQNVFVRMPRTVVNPRLCPIFIVQDKRGLNETQRQISLNFHVAVLHHTCQGKRSIRY